MNEIKNKKYIKNWKPTPIGLVIYDASVSTELEEIYPKLYISNVFNKNGVQTRASYRERDGSIIKLSSKNVTNVIGYDNYLYVFKHFLAINDELTKVKLILSLLTAETNSDEKPCQTENPQSIEEMSCTKFNVINLQNGCKNKKQQRMQRKIVPFVVKKRKLSGNAQQDVVSTKKIIQDLPPNEYPNPISIPSVCSENLEAAMEILNTNNNNNNNMIMSDNDSNEPSNTLDEVFSNRYYTTIKIYDGTEISVPFEPHDKYHLTAPDIMKFVTKEERKKLIIHQGFIDWQDCLETDEDGWMLIHLSILNDDIELLKRQCIVLKAKGESVDVMANGLTPLHLALSMSDRREFAKYLIKQKADLLLSVEGRTALHTIAELPLDVAKCATDTLTQDVWSILLCNDELAYPNMDLKTDEELCRHLFVQIGYLFDKQGYNPLMIASKHGNFEVVLLLLSLCQPVVNIQSPNCGKTALHHAMEAAAAAILVNKNYEKYFETIRVLIAYDADPSLPNTNGVSANELLAEYRINELNVLYNQEMSKKNSPNNEIGILNLKDGVFSYEKPKEPKKHNPKSEDFRNNEETLVGTDNHDDKMTSNESDKGTTSEVNNKINKKDISVIMNRNIENNPKEVVSVDKVMSSSNINSNKVGKVMYKVVFRKDLDKAKELRTKTEEVVKKPKSFIKFNDIPVKCAIVKANIDSQTKVEQKVTTESNNIYNVNNKTLVEEKILNSKNNTPKPKSFIKFNDIPVKCAIVKANIDSQTKVGQKVSTESNKILFVNNKTLVSEKRLNSKTNTQSVISVTNPIQSGSSSKTNTKIVTKMVNNPIKVVKTQFDQKTISKKLLSIAKHKIAVKKDLFPKNTKEEFANNSSKTHENKAGTISLENCNEVIKNAINVKPNLARVSLLKSNLIKDNPVTLKGVSDNRFKAKQKEILSKLKSIDPKSKVIGPKKLVLIAKPIISSAVSNIIANSVKENDDFNIRLKEKKVANFQNDYLNFVNVNSENPGPSNLDQSNTS